MKEWDFWKWRGRGLVMGSYGWEIGVGTEGEGVRMRLGCMARRS